MTGSFGQQTAVVLPRLRELGFEVAISAGAGLVGGFQEWKGIPVYPGDQADLFISRAASSAIRTLRLSTARLNRVEGEP
jgi:hypothetical protein